MIGLPLKINIQKDYWKITQSEEGKISGGWVASLHLGFVLKLPLKGKEAYVTPILITYFDFNVIYFKNDSPITLVRFRDYFSFAAIMFDYDIIVFFSTT